MGLDQQPSRCQVTFPASWAAVPCPAAMPMMKQTQKRVRVKGGERRLKGAGCVAAHNQLNTEVTALHRLQQLAHSYQLTLFKKYYFSWHFMCLSLAAPTPWWRGGASEQLLEFILLPVLVDPEGLQEHADTILSIKSNMRRERLAVLSSHPACRALCRSWYVWRPGHGK